MNNDLFEKAKQAVAEKMGYTNFEHFMYESGSHYEEVKGVIQEAAELHAQWIANEAVKADRAEATNEAYYDIHQDDHVVSCKALNRPLPFPQQPDER